MTEWIKFPENKPGEKDFEKKLVLSKSEGMCVCRWHGDYWHLDPMGYYASDGFIGDVTHWAELPEPPND